MTRHVRRLAAVSRIMLPVALVVWLSACHKWVEVEPPSSVLQEQAAKPVQEREELRLHIGATGAKFDGDPVDIGPDTVVLVRNDRRIPVPTKDISRVDVRRGDALGIGGVGLIVVAGLFGLLILAVASMFDS